jgi:hypothetical protein
LVNAVHEPREPYVLAIEHGHVGDTELTHALIVPGIIHSFVPIPPIPQPLADATQGMEHPRCAVLAVREIVDLAPEVPGAA